MRKRILATIAAGSAAVLIFLIIYGAVLMGAAEMNPLFLFFVIPLALLGAGMVCVLIARIKEIKGGEEDDLGNY